MLELELVYLSEEGASVERVSNARNRAFLVRFNQYQNEEIYQRNHTDIAEKPASPKSPTVFFPSLPPLSLLKLLPTAPPKMIPLGSSLSADHGRCFFVPGFS